MKMTNRDMILLLVALFVIWGVLSYLILFVFVHGLAYVQVRRAYLSLEVLNAYEKLFYSLNRNDD